MKKNKSLRTWPFWVLGIVVGILLVTSLMLNLAAVAVLAGGGSGSSELPKDEFPDLNEVGSYGSEGPKVVRIDLDAEITHDTASSLLGTSGHDRVESWLRQLRCATADNKVKGLLIEVDSPGGGVTSSDELYHEVCRFKEAQPGRVVVALVHDMAASGAYYAILGADCIVAQPTALVGSVGVLLNGVNASGLAQKLGIQDATLTSGANKDAMNPLKPLDPAQVALLQAEVDAMYERFLGLVAKHRKVDKTRLRKICDGRVMGVGLALENGLIDRVGYREDALELLAKLLEADSVRVVRYEESTSLFDELLGLRQGGGNLIGWVGGLLGVETRPPHMQARFEP